MNDNKSGNILLTYSLMPFHLSFDSLLIMKGHKYINLLFYSMAPFILFIIFYYKGAIYIIFIILSFGAPIINIDEKEMMNKK